MCCTEYLRLRWLSLPTRRQTNLKGLAGPPHNFSRTSGKKGSGCIYLHYVRHHINHKYVPQSSSLITYPTLVPSISSLLYELLPFIDSSYLSTDLCVYYTSPSQFIHSAMDYSATQNVTPSGASNAAAPAESQPNQAHSVEAPLDGTSLRRGPSLSTINCFLTLSHTND
jgi:hypothetical protein